MGKTFTDVVYVYMFSGGDQLTAARARSGQRIRSNSLRGKDRLEGMVPVIEDWHAKVCLLGVSKYMSFFLCQFIRLQCICAGHLETTLQGLIGNGWRDVVPAEDASKSSQRCQGSKQECRTV